MSDELDRLEALGRTEPPPADPMFVAALAGRLSRPARSTFRLPVLLPAAAMIAIVVGLGLLVLGGNDGDGGTQTIVVENAVDASVRPGQELAEGAVVETGPTGSVTVGNDTLGPGERAVVRKGRLQRPPIPVTFTLEGERLRRQVTLHWDRYEGTDFGRYVIVRGAQVRATKRAQDDVSFVDRGLRRARYVVVVLDRNNRAVARSSVLVL